MDIAESRMNFHPHDSICLVASRVYIFSVHAVRYFWDSQLEESGFGFRESIRDACV